MPAKKKTKIEWVGGLFSLPASVTGESSPHRHDALFWLGAEGAVLGQAMDDRGTLLRLASDNLRATIAHPLIGRPHAPDRVRVASPQLADVLRAAQPAIEIVCAPTPEVDALVASMREHLSELAEDESYLSPGVGPEAIAALFRAAAALHRAQPWKLPSDESSLISLTIEDLGVHDAVVSIIGQEGESFEVILFDDMGDFEAFLDASDAIEDGEEPEIPPHLALHFSRGADLSAAQRREITEHGWEVASRQGYPRLVAVETESAARPPTPHEVTIAEAMSLALVKLLEEKKALLAAWSDGEPVVRTLVVATHSGDVEVSVGAPYERDPRRFLPPFDVFAAMSELGYDGDDIDHEERLELQDELLRRFASSPEATATTDLEPCSIVMDFAAEHYGVTIATLEPSELREIVFDLIPRNVSLDPSEASWLIEENRAFFAFLKREFGFARADAFLRVLGGDAVKQLTAALSDTSKFGMAKTLVMKGTEAGFDMNTKEGIDAWMLIAQSRALPPSVQLPPLGAKKPPVDKAAARTKKNARKAARKARKKNR